MQYGRVEVHRRRQKLEAAFTALHDVEIPGELIAHYSRYLCVLVSGHVEQSLKALVTQYCLKRSSPEVRRYVSRQLKWLSNVNTEKLKQLVESFDADWWVRLEAEHGDDLSAFDSVAADRNAISHGDETGITIDRISQYFRQISRVLDWLINMFDPAQ